MVEGPRRSLCSDNRAPDGKELEGENRIRIRFSPPSFFHSGPGTRLSPHKNILFPAPLQGKKRIRIRFPPLVFFHSGTRLSLH